MGVLSFLKNKLGGGAYVEDLDAEQGYLEVDSDMGDKQKKLLVRPFMLEDFEDVKPVLDALREGRTIALVDMQPLKDRDRVELTRAINKLKKTTDAIEGEIAGFGENYLVITPQFATIHRPKKSAIQGAVEATEEADE